MNLPNKLTLFRIFLIPVFVACFFIPTSYSKLFAAAVFVIAYFTDFLDGFIAKKFNQVTDFGKLMDPMADKLLTGAAIVFMLANGYFLKPFGELFVFITISREFIVSSIRLVAANRGTVIAAGPLGKAKTMFQFLTLTIILVDELFMSPELKTTVDCTLIAVTTILTVWSMIDYLVKNKAAYMPETK